MKSKLKDFTINLLVFITLSTATNSFSYQQNFQILLTTVLIFTLLETFIEPIISILFTPINFITQGILRWVPSFITFYLLILSYPSLAITNLTIHPDVIPNIALPTIYFGKLTTLIAFTFFIKVIKKIAKWFMSA